MLTLTDADDAMAKFEQNDLDADNQVVIGLRVYTMKDAPVAVTGQLRNGNIIRENITMPKVL